MKRTKVLLTAVGICLSMIPAFPAQAANGQITCDRLIRENGYSVVANRGSEPVYQNGRIVSYRYFYRIQNRRNQRGVRNVTCVWNARRDSARLITR
ncbi:hypothetical protein NIES4075_47150 [Tolypothrix sp. NIES-4075]|uniref:hypothetical protein n=1 Tax=Tolypothrix sp. NIES-4075 TaxID=2005459 RepID=UPI000B5C7374|nr:hypothetical protein [Tolypothrix sp. NIES-4075]GAX43700.1 hypothetical protein NIES4075_47150 [Tolypothrix sp. NIES-4075]